MAFLKATTSSPVHGVHNNGNDNDITNRFHVVGDLTEEAWWEVNLEKIAIMISFHYYPRSTYPQSRNQPIDIFVLTKIDETSIYETCTSITAEDFLHITPTKPYVFSCIKHTKAQFIRLQKHENVIRNYLVFSEFMVYGVYI